MNKQKLKISFNKVILAAINHKCDDAHHMPHQYHEDDELCPVETDITENISILRQHMIDIGL